MATNNDLSVDVSALTDHLDGIEQYLLSVRTTIDNVQAAYEDDEGWVFRNNLRRLPEQVAVVHVALGRLLAVVDRVDSELPISGNVSLRGG